VFWWILLGLAVAALGVGLYALFRPWTRERADRAERISQILLLATGVWLIVIGLPYVLVWTRGLFGLAPYAQNVQTVRRLGAAGGIGGGLSLATGLAQVRRLWARKPKVPSIHASALSTFLTAHRSALLNLAASLAGPLLILGTALVLITSAAGSSAHGGAKWGWDIGLWVLVSGALGFLWLKADLNAWSPHSYYYKRLASMFAIGRWVVGSTDPQLEGDVDSSSVVHWPAPDGDPVAVLRWRIEDPEIGLTQFQPEEFPEVLICAAANVRDYGRIPTGFNVTSFVFSQRLVGGPLVGAVPTGRYEEALGGQAINLPESVSLAGAAAAPEMGKMTRAPLRFLMTMANVRLGAWVINPRHIEDLGQVRKPDHPRPGYLFKEMFGWNHLDADYLYVTDGGHYENLGLVEQLRRGCEWIFCIDAAGDAVTTFHTIGEAVAIAKAELGVDIDIAPDKEMAPAPDQDPGGPPHAPWVTKAFCVGTIHYPGRTEPGKLVYVKAGVPADASWDLKNFSQEHPHFPTDPTLDQLYDAERLGAYRALGELVTQKALDTYWDAFKAWKATR
jgi:hypothetical protein